jgi:uncharacterized protein YegL
MRKDLTEIVFILDRSGSMTGLESDTIGGYNSFLEKQKIVKGEANITTILFDDRYEVLHEGVDLKTLKPMTENEYYTRGNTALLDAIGKSITDLGSRLDNTDEDKKPSQVIFVITTDGEENSSGEYSYMKINNMITHQQKKYSWEFVFMGANMDAVKVATGMGIKTTNSFNFIANSFGIDHMYQMADDMVTCYRLKNNLVEED